VADSIPIIGGTGALGYGLAVRWAQAGQPIVIGSREAKRAEEAAERVRAQVAGAEVEGLQNAEAAARGPIVFLTVPFRAQSETLTNLKEALSPGQILVDCTVPLAAAVSGKATRTLGVWQGSAAQQAAEMVPEGVTVVSALHTVHAKKLAEGGPLDEDILVCGDRKADKMRVARLIEQIDGFRAVNAGALEMARIVETLTPDSRSRTCPRAITGRDGRAVRDPRRRHRRRQAGGGDAGPAGKRRFGDREHGGRHRDRGRRRLPRSGPGHLLAERRDRRGAGLGDQGRHLHRLRSPGQAWDT
jgi:NADPH-dependent F420 reductase